MKQVIDKFKDFGFGKNRKTLVVAIAILVAIPTVVGLASRIQNKPDERVLAANDVNNMLDDLAKLMALPNEKPTVATVSDIEKLKDQEFFTKAKNGDKVFIFPKAQKAILYRPSTKKLIEVAFYNTPPVTPQLTQTSSPTPTKALSLQDLINDSKPSVTPQISPVVTGEVSPVPSSPVSPTPSQ